MTEKTGGHARLQECCFIYVPTKGKRVIWELTHFCPHDCEYCLTSSNEELKLNRKFLDDHQTRILQFLDGMRVTDILLTGGEPLSLGDSLTRIIEQLGRRSISFSISTSGFPLKLLQEIASFKPPKKPRRVNLSFDARDDEKPSFWKSDVGLLDKIITLLEKDDVPVKLTSAITKANVKNYDRHLESLNSLVRNHLNISAIGITTLFPIGRGLECEGLNLKEIREILTETEKSGLLLKTHVSMVNVPSLHSPLQHCPAGQRIFSIMPDGEITPCSLLHNLSRSFSMGNCLKEPAGVVIDRLDNFAQGVRKHIDEIKLLNKRCMRCGSAIGCGGGCFATMPVLTIDHSERIICKQQPKILEDQQKKVFLSIEHPPTATPRIPSTTRNKSRLARQTERGILEYLKLNRPATDPAHSSEHLENVARLARGISRREGANEKIAVVAAYLHDLAPRNRSMHHFHTVRSARLAQKLLEKLGGFSSEEIYHIQQCIITSSYGAHLLGYKPHTIEAEVVRDADFLEAMGARGVGRAFSFGAYYGARKMGRVDFSPRYPSFVFDMNLTGPDRSPIHHFFTKLLRLKTLMLTSTGKQLAERRHSFMIEFLEEYAFEEALQSKTLQTFLSSFTETSKH